MMSMVCLKMNKKIMKTWDLMVIKEAFQISQDLEIFGEDNKMDKLDLKAFFGDFEDDVLWFQITVYNSFVVGTNQGI